MRVMMSAARVASVTVRSAACRASSRSGSVRLSQRTHVLASAMAAAIGWLISCAIDAVSSPIVITCAR
jgi:hypothetical protein